ncbi:MAG: glycosyltransferase family 39 protein, partial [Chloroflexota bacterium]
AELIRFGQVAVFYEVDDGGREGLYHVLNSTTTTFIGNHPFGYRLVSVWVGLIAVSLLYTLTRRLYGRFAGLAAMAAFAVPLWSLLLSRLISREALLPLIVIGVLMAFARALPVYRRPNLNPSTLPFAVLGFVLGIGFYVHPAHYIVVLAGMVFIAYMILTRQPMSRRTVGYLNFTIVVLIIVALPYLIAVFQTPELGGTARLSNVMTDVRSSGWLATLGQSLAGFFVRGDTNILHNLPGRPYMDPLSGLLVLWGISVSIRRFQEPRYALPLVMLGVLLPVALFAPQSPNFMAYVVILPMIAMFFALGAKRAAKSVPSKKWGGIAILVLLLGNLLWSVQGLAVWTQRDDVQTAYGARVYALAQYLDETISDTETVVCAPTLPAYPTWLAEPD